MELQVQVPEGWKLSSSISSELPESQRADAAKYLWEKSGGRCALCSLPLPADGKRVDADHTTARVEGAGGETELKNLYLAHRSCNASRKNLPFPLAKQLLTFDAWCRAADKRNFTDVKSKYIGDASNQVGCEISDSSITLDFDGLKREAPISIDPATQTQYAFMNVPVAFIKNDDESQPRYIERDHVRILAIDFSKHPVHEPSNCRLISGPGGLAELLQFDGQHKTTAQMVLGRSEVPMKLYIDPDEAMIQELVVQIQQGIKKRPLSTTDTLRKLDDVFKAKVEAYRALHDGAYPSEVQLLSAQPRQDHRDFKKRLLSNLDNAVLHDASFKLKPFASTRASKDHPFTDTVLVNRLIRPLMSQELVDDETLDQAEQRDRERAMVIHILNRIADNMLTDKWAPELDDDLQTKRARSFFYQGSIGFWMSELLLPSVKITMTGSQRPKLFRNQLPEADHERIDALVDTLCSWSIWSTSDDTQMAAMRSNTVSRVADAFPGYTQQKLMSEAQD